MPDFSTPPDHDWVTYFEGNAPREARLPFNAPLEDALTPAQLAALVRTLQRFHLGENGEGQYLKRFARQTGDAHYCRAIDLFVAEEQAHSRWFGLLLQRFEAPALQAHWSDAIFTKLRRGGGLHFELVTFLTAEIVGQKLFALLAQNCLETVAATVFAQVVRDESAHIAFHIDTLRRAFSAQSSLNRLLWHWKWKAMLAGAIAIVCLDQRLLFRELKISRLDFAARCFHAFDTITQRIWNSSPRISLVPLPPHRAES